MKGRRFCIFCFTAILVVLFSMLCGAANTVFLHKVVLDTPIYSEPSYTSEIVLENVKQNEQVEIVDEEAVIANGVEWIKIRYNGHYVGYVPNGYVYTSAKYDEYEVQVSKATGKSSSDTIYVYRYYDGAETVATLTDGDKVYVVLDGANYGDYYKISYGEYYYFIKKANVTTGLTYNQRLAVVIAGSLVAGLLAIGVVVVVMIHKRRRGGKKEA